MNTPKSTTIATVGGAAALALLLAAGNANAGDHNDNNKRGASIAISNTCELAQAPKPVLRVTTTIVNKSSGDVTPYFSENGMTVRAEEKGKGKGEKYQQVGDTAILTGSLGEIETDIQLCSAEGFYLGPDNTVSLNASVSINVDNDNKGEYSNRCSDDPATELVNEGKVVVSAAELDALCMLP